MELIKNISIILLFLGVVLIILDIWYHFEIWSVRKYNNHPSSEETLSICENKIKEGKFAWWHKLTEALEIASIKRVFFKIGFALFIIGILLMLIEKING